MDPNVCLAELVDAIRNYDVTDALERLDDLLEWCRKGGFVPLWHYEQDHLEDDEETN